MNQFLSRILNTKLLPLEATSHSHIIQTTSTNKIEFPVPSNTYRLSEKILITLFNPKKHRRHSSFINLREPLKKYIIQNQKIRLGFLACILFIKSTDLHTNKPLRQKTGPLKSNAPNSTTFFKPKNLKFKTNNQHYHLPKTLNSKNTNLKLIANVFSLSEKPKTHYLRESIWSKVMGQRSNILNL